MQADLFATTPAVPADGSTAALDAGWCVGASLPRGLRLGTSGWAHPGWAGLVYPQRLTEAQLHDDGLRVYASRPTLSAVELDRGYVRLVDEHILRQWAEQTPTAFRFVLPVHAAVTAPVSDDSSAAFIGRVSDRYLDAAFVTERIVAPAQAALGERLGPVVLTFSSMHYRQLRDPSRFAAQLGEFLSQLPRGVSYAVELRHRELLSAAYADQLARHAVTHCFNVYPGMPSVLEQAERLGDSAWFAGPVLLKWVLHPRLDEESARRRHFPYDRLLDPDHRSRAELAELIGRIERAGNEMILIVGNRAEGSAPRSLRAICAQWGSQEPEVSR